MFISRFSMCGFYKTADHMFLAALEIFDMRFYKNISRSYLNHIKRQIWRLQTSDSDV